jgi:mannose-6-phosphate isomerase-like protein (cupin superfamily)
VPFIDRSEMVVGRPLPGWTGRFFHASSMTFGWWEIDDGAAPLHEHHHPYEEVWNVVEGEIVLLVDHVEQVVAAGAAAVIPMDVVHAARPVGRCRVVVTDHPVRYDLPGVERAASEPG